MAATSFNFEMEKNGNYCWNLNTFVFYDFFSLKLHYLQATFRHFNFPTKSVVNDIKNLIFNIFKILIFNIFKILIFNIFKILIFNIFKILIFNIFKIFQLNRL